MSRSGTISKGDSKGECYMKKGLMAVLLVAALVAALSIAACSSGSASSSASASASSEAASSASSEAASSGEVAEALPDATVYGYAGDDPVEAAAYVYMAEEVGKNFDKADASIPIVQIVSVDYTNPDDVLVYGDFWVDNYNVNGDTLECVSGGNFPGVMHMAKSGDGYKVTSFDMVADGADFDPSAKELFGENYDAFMKVYSDDEARKELRTITVSDYVNLNHLDDIVQYQDYGWDPVKLYKQ